MSLPNGSYHEDPRIQAELNLRQRNGGLPGMTGYLGQIVSAGGQIPSMGMQDPRFMGGFPGIPPSMAQSGPQLSMPQSSGSFSDMSDAQLEAEIAKLRGGSPGADFRDYGQSPVSGGLSGLYGGSLSPLQSGIGGLHAGLGRDLDKNPILSGSEPGLYPLEELGTDASHRLPFEGQGAGLDHMFGGLLPGASLPSQMGLPQALSAQEQALEDIKLRREALEKAFG